MEYEKILANFKPSQPIDDIDIICRLLGLKDRTEFYAKGFVMVVHAEKIPVRIQGEWKIIFRYSLKDRIGNITEHEETLSPSTFGFVKQTETLLSTIEEGIINIETRRTESGRFLFKVTVKLPSEGEYESKFCFWRDGRVQVVDFTHSLFTDELQPEFLMLEENQTFSNLQDAFKERALLPNSVFRELNASFYDPINKHKPIKLHYALKQVGSQFVQSFVNPYR